MTLNASSIASVLISLLAGCSSSSPGITCGEGTHLVGATCEANVPVDGSSPQRVDAGPPVKTGDPCIGGRDTCYDGRVFTCVRIAGPTQDTLQEATSCHLLDGACTQDSAGNAACTGGGYVACDTGTALRSCYSGSVMATCNGRWAATDCALAGPSGSAWTCQGSAGNAVCAAP